MTERRLLGAPDAALYIGVSVTTLKGLPIRRRVLGGRKLYDKLDLDLYASDLPYEGESEANSCDVFGMAR